MLKKTIFSILSLLLIIIFFASKSFAQPMIVLATSVHQFQIPVLKGNETNQVIQINIETDGTINPIALHE